MKAIVHAFHTEIFPTTEEVKSLCRPGEQANTCVWLLWGNHGFECASKNRPIALAERWEKGLTSAKRDGCERVNNWSPAGQGGEVEVP
jgi:hypothetical protein